MTYDEIFEAYYNLYRLEAEIPAEDDDEYKIGLRLANEAIARWSQYDGTYWKELFTTLSVADDGDKTVGATTEYVCPADMAEVGGFVKFKEGLTTVARLPILEPQDAQFRADNARFAYFTGNPNQGFILHLNVAPDTNLQGTTLDYVYYKKPTLLTDGDSTTEMSNPYFMVHRMLAQRFRGSRNPYYASAKQDAEDALRTMQMDNNSGSWANPWQLADNSGTAFGV